MKKHHETDYNIIKEAMIAIDDALSYFEIIEDKTVKEILTKSAKTLLQECDIACGFLVREVVKSVKKYRTNNQ